MITIIGLDIAKNVFQVHGLDETGQPALRRKLCRAEVLRLFYHLEPALVGIEACHTAHHWAREIARSPGSAHAAAVREALRQEPEERRGGCRSDLRSGAAADYAVHAGRGRRPTSRSPAPPNPRPSDPTAQQPDQRHQSALR